MFKRTCCLTQSPDAGNAPADYLEGMVLLDTLMRYGQISYDKRHVVRWDHRWHPSEKTVQDLERDWKLITVARVQFRTDGVSGVYCEVFKVDLISMWGFGFVRWVSNNPIKFCLVSCCVFLPIYVCCDKIKPCIIGSFHCIRGTLISFSEWLREKCHKRRQVYI